MYAWGMGVSWGNFEDYYLHYYCQYSLFGAIIGSISFKKAQLHPEGSEGEREENSEAGDTNRPGAVHALVQDALEAAAALLRTHALLRVLTFRDVLIHAPCGALKLSRETVEATLLLFCAGIA